MSKEKSNLEKKYLYLPKIMRDKNNKKHYNNSQRFFKEIYHYDDKICKIKKKLIQVKENTIQFMIMENKDIFEKWKKQKDFIFIVKKLLDNQLILRRVHDTIKENEKIKINKLRENTNKRNMTIKNGFTINKTKKNLINNKINKIPKMNNKIPVKKFIKYSIDELEKDDLLLTNLKQPKKTLHNKSKSLPLIIF
jgi:hypothetical protein